VLALGPNGSALRQEWGKTRGRRHWNEFGKRRCNVQESNDLRLRKNLIIMLAIYSSRLHIWLLGCKCCYDNSSSWCTKSFLKNPVLSFLGMFNPNAFIILKLPNGELLSKHFVHLAIRQRGIQSSKVRPFVGKEENHPYQEDQTSDRSPNLYLPEDV
jgi:hypothetical protein